MATTKKRHTAEQTYYRWRREYGGLKVSQAKRLEDLKLALADDRSLSSRSSRAHSRKQAGPHKGTGLESITVTLEPVVPNVGSATSGRAGRRHHHRHRHHRRCERRGAWPR